MNKILHVNLLPWLLVFLMATASFVLMFHASLQESATMDELAHIPSGYGYVKHLDYRLNPEHPPLVKALAALPLLFQPIHQKINFPTEKSSWQTDINGQWEIGRQFLYESKNDADKIIQWSRIGPMILTIILIFFIYLWSKELMGRWWALIPAFLFSASPNALAHGHYVTTDIGAALGIFIASYYFVKSVIKPSKQNIIFAGLAFGLAQLMKFSALFLIPLFIFLIIIFYIWKIYYDKQQNKAIHFRYLLILAFHHIKNITLIFIIGLALIYVVYFLFTINYPIERNVADAKSTLISFIGDQKNNSNECGLNLRCLAKIDIWMINNEIFRPIGQYLLGALMVIQRSSGGNTGYFLGEVSNVGWWYYFPVLFILKESIPSLILIGLALFLSVWKILKSKKFKIKNISNFIGLHFSEFAMISFIILYWLYSIKSPLNIGFRHILPTMPFIYILIISSIKRWINDAESSTKKRVVNFKILLVGALIIWYAAETLFVSPHFLSYFNQFAGGTNNGYKYAVDSNYDWGQDLKRLKNFIENPPAGEKIEKIAIDYFGGGNPKYYLNNASLPDNENKVEYWQSSKGNPKNQGIDWLAVSINHIQNASGALHPSQSRNPKDEYLWLEKPYEPYARAGKSIFIYKL